jgi:hypothetical protein
MIDRFTIIQMMWKTLRKMENLEISVAQADIEINILNELLEKI